MRMDRQGGMRRSSIRRREMQPDGANRMSAAKKNAARRTGRHVSQGESA